MNYARTGPDLRGNSTDRRNRKLWLLSEYGDGTTVKCHYCDKMLDYSTLTVDRIIPETAGGRYTRDNIVPACDFHNKSRQNRDVDEYMEHLEMNKAAHISVVTRRLRARLAGVADTIDLKGVAKTLLDWAAENEAETTPLLQQLAADHGGKMQGLDYKFKEPESIERKLRTKLQRNPQITEEEVVEVIQDVLRYTVQFPTREYTEGVQEALYVLEDQGYTLMEVENTWIPGDPYSGINTIFLTPAGFSFELQFHTGQSFDTKEYRNHRKYEEFRDPDTPLARRIELYEEMAANWDVVPVPEGVEEIGDSKFYELPLS